MDHAVKGGKKLVDLLGKYKFVLLVLLAGILLLLMPAFGGGEKSAGAQGAGTSPPESSFNMDELEKKLSDTLSRVDGAGKVSVVLTVKAGTRQILAQDVTTAEKDGASEKTTTTVVTSKGSSGQEAVPLQQVYPTFQGALVVCPGGGDPEVSLQISQAVSALTGLGADKISICKGE
ncbi:MAG: stage III sporulation protein AG [Clostridia bacterium]|nr:stage III sporulation protein AG [Clostridia bacterium]